MTMATATKATITLEVDSDLAAFYENASRQDRMKIGRLTSRSMKRLRSAKQSKVAELFERLDASRLDSEPMSDEEIAAMVKEEMCAYRAGH